METKTIEQKQVAVDIGKSAGTPKEVEKAFGLEAGTSGNLRLGFSDRGERI